MDLLEGVLTNSTGSFLELLAVYLRAWMTGWLAVVILRATCSFLQRNDMFLSSALGVAVIYGLCYEKGIAWTKTEQNNDF